MTRIGSGILAAAFAALAEAAMAQNVSENRVATRTDWSVFQDNGICWSVSAPKESVVTRDGRLVASARRGDILLFITYRPSDQVAGEVSFTGGYPFAEGSTVTIEIGGATFELFTEGEHAWLPTPSDDQKIITAMKRGSEALVTGRSARNGVTKDTFSLLGFTAAVEDAEKRCSG